MTEAQASAAPAATPIANGASPKAGQPSGASVPDFASTKHRVVVDGKEIEVDYEELRRGYAHRAAANQRLQEAAEARKALQQKEQYLQSLLSRFENPQDALTLLTEKYGKKQARELMEAWLIGEMEYEAMPEAERRARELEEKLKTLEAEKEETEKERKERERREIEAKAHADIDQEVAEALAKIGRKPTPRLVIRVVDEMILRSQHLKERVPAHEALKYAQEGVWGDIAEYLEHTPPEEALKRLPKKFVDSLRQYEVSQVLGQKQQRRAKAPEAPAEKPEPGQKKSLDERFEELRNRVGSKRRA